MRVLSTHNNLPEPGAIIAQLRNANTPTNGAFRQVQNALRDEYTYWSHTFPEYLQGVEIFCQRVIIVQLSGQKGRCGDPSSALQSVGLGALISERIVEPIKARASTHTSSRSIDQSLSRLERECARLRSIATIHAEQVKKERRVLYGLMSNALHQRHMKLFSSQVSLAVREVEMKKIRELYMYTQQEFAFLFGSSPGSGGRRFGARLKKGLRKIREWELSALMRISRAKSRAFARF